MRWELQELLVLSQTDSFDVRSLLPPWARASPAGAFGGSQHYKHDSTCSFKVQMFAFIVFSVRAILRSNSPSGAALHFQVQSDQYSSEHFIF